MNIFVSSLEFIQENNFLWIVVPIFFIGIITDKYQEEFKTSVGNAISNGTLILFTGFSWIQLILSRTNFPIDYTISQLLFSIFIIIYGFSIIASGFKTGKFAVTYGRIRVVTFLLVYFSIMIYYQELYNFLSILFFVFIFPFYYAFITEMIRIMPNSSNSNIIIDNSINKTEFKNNWFFIKQKIKYYLK